jgi:hypothetical protein
MKTYKDYLMESKKVYEFKVKIAREVETGCADTIKLALNQYKVESCSTGKRTPIQETQVDFPELKNVSVTIFDVTLAYPANSVQVREAVALKLGLPLDCVKVRNLQEEAEIALNHEHDRASGEALLGKDYETTSHQDLVGEKHLMSMLKELNKTKHGLEQYTGVNDQILAKSEPTYSGPAVKASALKQNNNELFAKINNPDPGTRIK